MDFGVHALLLKIVPGTLPSGFADPLRQWPLYLMVIVTPVGFLLNQNAFQAGGLIAPVLAIITAADPVVSVATGAAFLHEKIATAPVDLAAEGLALAVTIGGIIALAQRAPQVARIPDAPRPAAPAQAAVGAASARPGTAMDDLTGIRLAALAVTPARSAALLRGGDAGQAAVLIAFCRRVARTDDADAAPYCGTGRHGVECPCISPAA